MHMGMQHQGLAPGVECSNDPRLRAQILRVREQLAHAIAHRLKQERTHHRHVGQPQRVEVMRERKNPMGVITGQKPRLLESQPALGLKVGPVRARPVPTRVVPDARHMTLRTGLDMSAEYRRSALHDGACGFADVGGERVRLLVGRKRVLEDGLERDKRHRCLRPRRWYGTRVLCLTVSRQLSPRQAVSPMAVIRSCAGGRDEERRGLCADYAMISAMSGR
jgi:hypothetical protein